MAKQNTMKQYWVAKDGEVTLFGYGEVTLFGREEESEEEEESDEPKIVEKDECDDCEGKCRADETETCEKCAVELRIGCGNNPSDESIFNGFCDDCREEGDLPLCKDCEIETRKHCDECGGYGSDEPFSDEDEESDEDLKVIFDELDEDEEDIKRLAELEAKLLEVAPFEKQWREELAELLEKREQREMMEEDQMDEPKIVDVQENLTKLIALSVKPKSYAEMSEGELEKMESEIAAEDDGSDGSLELDTCVACGKTVVVDYIDGSGYTISNCNYCDSMCCRECLEKYSTKEYCRCPKCVEEAEVEAE